MRRAFTLLFAVLLAVLSPAQAADWAPIKHDGRDYVSFDSLAKFYGLKDLKRDGSSVVMSLGVRSLRGQANSVEFFINNLKFNLSYPVIEHEGKLCVSRMDLVKIIEPVLRPSLIKNPTAAVDTIILDPGHGGHDNGAVSNFGYEKTFTLDVANRTRLLLLQAGFKVFMTRSTDTFIPLDGRVQFANKFPSALFVSIHFNSGGQGTGLETYTLVPRGVPSMMADGPRVSDLVECRGNARDAENIALATAMHASMIIRSKMYDRGIKRGRFVVIRDVAIPGVLIEGGFLSNNYDAKIIATPEYRQGMANSILQAVQIYKRAVSAKGTQYTAAANPSAPTDAGSTPTATPAPGQTKPRLCLPP